MSTHHVIRLLSAGLATAALGGCALETAARNDLAKPGGETGQILNVVTPAATKEMELFRGAELLAIIAETGANSIGSDPAKQESFVKEIVKANGDLNDLHRMMTNHCNANATNMTDGCRELFEGRVPEIEGDLVSIAEASLPMTELQTLLGEVEKENILGAVETTVSMAGQLVLVFHEGAATHRASVEVVMEYSPPGAYATFDAAEKAYETAGPAVGGLAPDEKAVNAMYNIAYRACNKVVASMSSQTLAALTTATIKPPAGAPAGTPPTCAMAPMS